MIQTLKQRLVVTEKAYRGLRGASSPHPDTALFGRSLLLPCQQSKLYYIPQDAIQTCTGMLVHAVCIHIHARTYTHHIYSHHHAILTN